jgi:polyisoprenoid-binding protein YceI
VEVTIPARSLKSGNKKMDTLMLEALKVQGNRNATINFRLLNLWLAEPVSVTNSNVVLQAQGALTVAGVTRTNRMPVYLQLLGDGQLHFSGSTDLKMTAYKIRPPEIPGLLKTDDDVRVKFDWVIAPGRE